MPDNKICLQPLVGEVKSMNNRSVTLEDKIRQQSLNLSLSFQYSRSSSLGGSRASIGKTESFLEKRKRIKVFVDKEDLTPDDIIDPTFAAMDETAKHAAFAYRSNINSESIARMLKSRSMMEMTMKVFATTINLDDMQIKHNLNTEYAFRDDKLERAPSAFYTPKINPVTSYPPQILVTLKETETYFLFDLPCLSYEKGTVEGNAAEQENAYYEYITVGKGKIRKMINEETQTKEIITQTRHTLAIKPQKKNALSFASKWDMLDTYKQIAKEQDVAMDDEMILYRTAPPSVLRKKKPKSILQNTVKSFKDIAKTPEFLDAKLVTERVLATLKYGNAQKTFHGLVDIDPLSLDLVYIYTMNLLWVLECEETENRPVTCLSFNKLNSNILAVAHGKFTYADDPKGIICIWCTKNPCKPERIYRFENAVTSMDFSVKNPNWLACGFWNGDIIVIDITYYTVTTMATSQRETNPCFEPIWVSQWLTQDRIPVVFPDGVEYVLATCEDGRINTYTVTKSHELLCTPMMRVTNVEGNLKGLATAKSYIKSDVSIARNPGVLCMLWHPVISHIYFVGTVKGCVYRCSKHYLNQHIDVYRAHAGPVYDIGICPFDQSLIVTCGADSAVRLWIEGIDDAIITLMCPFAVYGVAFCPKNATILVSVSGNILSVWDLRKKTHMPCAEYKFPGDVVLTYVQFSKSGDNVFVGDTFGRVHTFHIEDTPIPPYYQSKLLNEVIRKALHTRPNLLKQLDKIRKLKEMKNKKLINDSADS